MKKLWIETKTKIIDNSVEDVIDLKQTVVDINETYSIYETTIAASGTYTFGSPAGKGIKTLKITSDVALTMSYTSMANTYSLPVRFKEMTIVTNGEDSNISIDWIAEYGSVSLTNTSTEDVAHIKIIFTY